MPAITWRDDSLRFYRFRGNRTALAIRCDGEDHGGPAEDFSWVVRAEIYYTDNDGRPESAKDLSLTTRALSRVAGTPTPEAIGPAAEAWILRTAEALVAPGATTDRLAPPLKLNEFAVGQEFEPPLGPLAVEARSLVSAIFGHSKIAPATDAAEAGLAWADRLVEKAESISIRS